MPTSWLSWRRSLACKTQPGDVHDPKSINAESTRAKVEAAVFVSRKVYMRSGCSRSIANLRDVIHSSRRIDGAHVPAMPNFSPKSVESNDFVQSISHEMLVQEHGCSNHTHYKHPHQQHSLHGKLISLDDIVASHHPRPYHHHHQRSNGSMENITANMGTSGSFYGTPLHPSMRKLSTSTHPATPLHHSQVASRGSSSFRKLSGCYDCKNPEVAMVIYKTSTVAATTATIIDGRNGMDVGNMQASALPPAAAPKAVCQRCGETFPKYEGLEQHHLLKHAVAELQVGDSSRNVVEIIFRTSWLRPATEPPAFPVRGGGAAGGGGGGHVTIVRVLKVNNLARTLARFEDYREGVKMRASKLPKKHPRCLADGNELLRFYGARLDCELLGIVEDGAGSTAATPCSSATCSICKIIRTGFPKSRGPAGSCVANRGILTTATSGRAHQLMMAGDSGGNVQEADQRSGAGMGAQFMAAREGDVGARSSRQLVEEALRPHAGCAADRRQLQDERSTTGGLMAMLVCRVIAGRVLKPPQTTSSTSATAAAAPPTPPHSGEIGPPGAGFDSVAGGEVGSLPAAGGGGLYSRFEELTVFNPRAILPCFVVLYTC